jgi:hypothetical protein
MDEFLFKAITKKFKRDMSINLFSDQEIEQAHSFEAKDQKATITILVIGKNTTNTQHVPLMFYKIYDHKLLCEVIVPTRFPIGSEGRTNMEQCIIEDLQIFVTNIEQKCRQQIVYRLCFIPELDFCSKSVSLLLAYIAHRTKSCDAFKIQLEEIISRDRQHVLASWKKWLSDFSIAFDHHRPFNV